MKTEAVTFIKEDILALGQMVGITLAEMLKLLKSNLPDSLQIVEKQEELINQTCQQIEEKCLDLLLEKESMSAQEIRLVVGSTIIAAKLERVADHANRVAKIACWAHEDGIAPPAELIEMSVVIERMVKDVLLAFLTDDATGAQAIVQSDNRVDYLDDTLSQKLLADLGDQERFQAQMQAQFLFAARFLERMGDACASVAKRVYFISTGLRLKVQE